MKPNILNYTSGVGLREAFPESMDKIKLDTLLCYQSNFVAI